jgi:hypothetical protein
MSIQFVKQILSILAQSHLCLLEKNCRSGNFVFKRLLTLSSLTTRHLVPRLHCDLVACQRKALATSHFELLDLQEVSSNENKEI